MDMTIRAMKPDERNYSYTQEKSVQKNTGCIGHLRGDMGRSGEEFYTSWDDHEASLKRRNTVIRLMYDYGYISQQEKEEATAEPLVLAEKEETHRGYYRRSA